VIVLETDSPAPAFLVTSENHYPGWKAEVDGKPQALYYTNVAFRGLPVPEGRHTIEMRFQPPILVYSAAVSLFAWGPFLVFVIRSTRWRRRGGA
jgi:uncharacterized membrane protein YfhO